MDLLALPVGAVLAIGDQALLAVPGLRNPCWQINDYRKGLLGEVVHRGESGDLVRRAGIMAVVLAGGPVHVGAEIRVAPPPPPHQAVDGV